MPICIGASAQLRLHRCAGAYEPTIHRGLHIDEKSAQSDHPGGGLRHALPPGDEGDAEGDAADC